MDEDVLLQELVDRLTFEVETLTSDKVVKFPNTNGTPLNVKVRMRNKDEPKLIQRGIISAPRSGNRLTTAPGIQLVGSKQTMLSFNVFMEASSSKDSTFKSRKQGFHFFKLGGCLGTSYDKDNDGPYLPSTSNKDALRSRGGSKSDSLILDEVRDLEDLPGTLKLNTASRNQKGLFGKCKPGGCLDPPFGEDKYSYSIPKVQPQILDKPEEVENKKENINIVNSIKPKQIAKNSKDLSNTTEKVNKSVTETKPILNIFPRTGEEHSLESKYSNSIITYPPGLTSSKTENNHQSTDKKSKNRSFDNGSPRHSFEHAETYFIPPKDIIRYKEEERKYSRELSNDKIKSNDDTKSGATVDKQDAKISKKETVKLQQDIGNLQYKEKAHQELTKQADLKISANTYLSNKSIVPCGETEDVINENSESDREINENTNTVITPAFAAGSANSNDHDEPKKKPINKIQRQGSSSLENNSFIQEMLPSNIPKPHITETVLPQDTYPNRDILRCGENEDDIDVQQSIESPNSTKNNDTNVSNLKLNTPKSLSEPTKTDNVFDKDIHKLTTREIVMMHDTFPKKDVLRCGENEGDINGASDSPNKVNEKNTNKLRSNEATPDYFTDTVNKVNYGDLKNVPGKIENQMTFAKDAFKENDLDTQVTAEISSSRNSKKAYESPDSETITSALFSDSKNANKPLSNENNTRIQATSPSNIPKHDTYPSKRNLKSNDDTDETSSYLKDITSPTEKALKTTDTDQVSSRIETFDTNQTKNDPVSRDSVLSENKEFATSSIDTINSSENLTSTHSNTKTKGILEVSIPPNIENVIIQNDILKQERSSAIFQKTPFIAVNEPSVYYDDINKINPIRRSTFPTVESRTSLQKHIEEISTQRNATIGFDPQLKIGDESVLVDSKPTEYLNTGVRITNSNSAINMPHDTKETVLLASPSDKKESHVNESIINLNADTTLTEFLSQQQNIEGTSDKTNSGQPIFDTSSISNSKKEANYLASDTQSSSARYHAVNNDSSQLSTISVGKVDIQPDLVRLSTTRSSNDLREKDKVETSFAIVDDNKFKFNSITQQEPWNQKLHNENFTIDNSIFHPREPTTILLNLSFQSYINDNNERIVQTLNPLVKPQSRYTNDTVTAIQSLLRHGNEIRIPVDPENDLILNFLNKNQKPDEVNTDKHQVLKQPIQSETGEENRSAIFPDDMLMKNLTIIYEQELIPLHDVIKDLTKEINGLLAQQELLKTKLRDTKRSRQLRLIPVNNRCGCRRN